MADTQPATNMWTSFAIRNEQTAGYCFGYGSAFMNGYFDSKDRPVGNGIFGDFSKPEYLTQGAMVQLKIALSLAARVERGSMTLVLNDSPDWANHLTNMDGNAKSYGQLMKYLSATEPMAMLTMNELQNGALNYDGTVAFFEKFKRIIILLSGSPNWLVGDALCKNLSDAIGRGAPVVCVHADGYSSNSNHTFNRIFGVIGVQVAGANYTHLYAEAITDYKNIYGDDLSWKSITSLYGGRRMFISGAAAYRHSRSMPTAGLDGFPGTWAQGVCVDVPFTDSIYIPNIVVFRPNCCYNEGDVYSMEFDVPATVVKPTDFKTDLANGILHFDWWHELQTAEHAPEVLHVRARGWHVGGGMTYTTNAIRYRGSKWDAQRSYNVMVFSRATGDVLDYRSFDVYGNAAKAAECAAFLNAQDASRIVLVVTSDEPTRNLTAELQSALIRIGAGAATLRKMKVRSAYMLLGIPGVPVGIERYKGDVNEDPNAVVDAAFDFRPDGARPIEPRMSDTTGKVIVATLQGIAERALFQANWDSYQNQKAIGNPAVAAFNARWVKNALNWIRRGTTMEVLFVPTKMATTGDWNPMNTDPNGCSSIMDYIRAAGFNVSVLDHTKISKPVASAYGKYDVVVFWAAGGGSDDPARMQILMPVLQTVVKGGAGLFAISDTAHPTMNALADMYSVQTNFVAGIQPDSFNVERARAQHGDHVIFEGLQGSFANDSAAGGFLTQTRLLWPYCVDGEALEVVQLKENGRIARFRYTKILDGMDNRKVFTLDAWTKLTDLRFKKIDMSDTDKWPLTIEMPCALVDDVPQYRIDDVEVEEGNSGHTQAVFTVSLAWPLRGRPAIISWKVVDGTATTAISSNAEKMPKSLLIDEHGNWHSVYIEYDLVRIAADGAFPKFYNGTMLSGSWQRRYFKNILDWMQRGRAKRRVLFLGDQADVNVNYATLGAKGVDFGDAVPATIREAGYTVDSMVWQNFYGGKPSVDNFLVYDSIVFISSTTGASTAIPPQFSKNMEAAVRKGMGLFAITDHDVFTKSFTSIMNRFGVRIYNDPTEASMVYLDQCRAALENKALLEGITIPVFQAPGSISAFIVDPAVMSPPDLDPPFSGELIFSQNEIQKQIAINVIGELLPEDDEFFYVDLFNQSRGDIIKGRGVGTIINDDGDLFNTRQLDKIVSWSGYIAGGDWPTVPDVSLFLIPVPAKYGHTEEGGTVWISTDRVDVVQADRSGWNATYKFTVGRQTACTIRIVDDDSSNTKIYNSAGGLVFEWGSGGDGSSMQQPLLLQADEYTVVCWVHNDANGNDYWSNPGYLGVSIRRA